MRRLLWLLVLLPACAMGQPADGSVARPDLTLHYTSLGYGAPLLILSGGPGLEVSYMEDLVKPLSQHNRCILLEQRGTGRSQPAKLDDSTYLLDSYVEDLEALRKSLHLSQFNMLGHSWGGVLAMAYTAKYPTRVHSLVLLSSAGMDEESLGVLPGALKKRLAPEDVASQKFWSGPEQRAKDPDHAASMAMAAVFPGYFYDRKIGLANAKKMGNRHLVNHGVTARVFAGLDRTGYDLRVRLTAYHGPAFISQGRQDVIGEDTAAKIHNTIYGSQVLYIDHCGHFEWLEKPNELLTPLEAFLAANTTEEELPDEFPVPLRGLRHGGHGHGRRPT